MLLVFFHWQSGAPPHIWSMRFGQGLDPFSDNYITACKTTDLARCTSWSLRGDLLGAQIAEECERFKLDKA